MQFFEIKVRYARNNGEDNAATIKETYIVEDITFGAAEKRVIESIAPLAIGDIDIVSMKKTKIYDFVNVVADKSFFKCKVELITIEESGKEKRTKVVYYVGAESIEDARKRICAEIASYDADLKSVEETNVEEIIRL